MRWSEAGYLSQFVLTHALRQVSVSLILSVRQNMKKYITFVLAALLSGCFPVPVVENRVHAIDIVPESVGLAKDRLFLFTNVGIFFAVRSTPKVSEGARSSYILRPFVSALPQDLDRVVVSHAPRDSAYYVIDSSALDGDRFSFYLSEKRGQAETSDKVRIRPFPYSRDKSEAFLIESQSSDFPDDHIPGIRMLIYESTKPDRYSIIVIPHDSTYKVEKGIGIRLIPDPIEDVH